MDWAGHGLKMIDIFLDMAWAARINLYFALLSLPLGFVFAIGLALGLRGRGGLVRAARPIYRYAGPWRAGKNKRNRAG